jgi:TolB-like protein
MGRSGSADSILFEGFRLDHRGGCLFRQNPEGVGTPVALGSRALDLLRLLVERKGELVSKDEIMKAVWPGRVVEDANLNVQISKLRHILDQNREQGSCIQTIPGHGYSFVAPVTPSIADAPSTFPVVSKNGAHPRPDLSIVVLPFTNLSDDREQQFFAEGITDDLTTELSRIAGSFVIACNTAFSYRDKPVDAKDIGRELGVRYVLEGSVRRADDRVRVNVQLIDAETGANLWADRFDTDRANLEGVQNEITGRLAQSLNLELVEAVGRRIERESAADPDAQALVMRGWAWYYRSTSAKTMREAQTAFERALEIDLGSVEAKLGLAAVLVRNLAEGWSPPRLEDQVRAERLLLEALECDPNRATAHYSMGMLRRVQNRLTEARIEFETTIALDRNHARAFFRLGQTLTYLGRPEAGILQIDKAIRLNPRDPNVARPMPIWVSVTFC